MVLHCFTEVSIVALKLQLFGREKKIKKKTILQCFPEIIEHIFLQQKEQPWSRKNKTPEPMWVTVKTRMAAMFCYLKSILKSLPSSQR